MAKTREPATAPDPSPPPAETREVTADPPVLPPLDEIVRVLDQAYNVLHQAANGLMLNNYWHRATVYEQAGPAAGEVYTLLRRLRPEKRPASVTT